MEFRVLGPVEVVQDGRVVRVSAAKDRLLLACLVANANEVVGVDRLIDVLWDDEPPRSAHKTLQTYVLHLRSFLGERLVTRAPGYLLEVPAASIDAVAFERDVSAGRLSLARGDAAEGVARLRDATARWRGRPYEGFDHPMFVAESVRLEELRLGAIEDALEARLDIDEPGVLVPDLEALAASHPLRERTWTLLMHALYRSGRQADALRTYQRARSILIDELGLEPGERLRRMEAAILNHDPSLDGRSVPPSAQYATTADGLRIGYWVRGEGPPDIVLCAEWVFNLELLWEILEVRPLLERLSRGARLIVVQRRGTGVSDRSGGTTLAPPEECVADVDAVLDEQGCGRVALVGWGHGGQVALCYAARRPARVSCVAVVNGYARLSAAPDYEAGLPEEVLEGFLSTMDATWGTDGPAVPIFGPVVGRDIDVRIRAGRLNRLVASPREAVAIQRAIHDFDVRQELPAVQVPALVLHLADSITGAANARWLAAHLPNAAFLELPGWYLPTAAEARTVGDAVVEFIRRPDEQR